MTGKPDDGLRTLIRQHLPTWRGLPVQWVSIETGLTQSGVPDLHGACGGRMVWVECKATSVWKFEVRDMQVGFARTARLVGSPLYYLVRRRPTSIREMGRDELWLGYATLHLDAFLEKGVRAFRMKCMGVAGPASWDWDRVGRVLFGDGATKWAANRAAANRRGAGDEGEVEEGARPGSEVGEPLSGDGDAADDRAGGPA